MAEDKGKNKAQPTPKQASQKSDPNRALKIVLIVVGVLVVLGILGSMLFAWGLFKFGESALEKAANGDVEITNDGVRVETDEGSFESGNTLPDGFPSEVPIYDGAELASSTSTRDRESGGERYHVSYETQDSRDQVNGFYESELEQNGWSIDRTSTFQDTVSHTASRDNVDLTVTIFAGQDGNTQITLNVSKEAE